MKSNLKLSVLLTTTLVIASACESSSTTTPSVKPTSKVYNAQLMDGLHFHLDVKLPPNTTSVSTPMTFAFTMLQPDLITWADYVTGSGDCSVATAADDSGITTCHVTSATGPAAAKLLDQYIRFQVTDGIWIFIQTVTAAEIATVSKFYLDKNALPGILTDEKCNDIVGSFVSLGGDPQFLSYFEFNLSTKNARHADFTFKPNGSSYTTLYSTTSPDVSGLENILNISCKDGYRIVNYEKSGSPKAGYLFQTTSGALIELALFNNFAFRVNANDTLPAVTMANKKFKGTFLALAGLSKSLAVNFKVAASGSDAAMITEYNLPAALPPGEFESFNPAGAIIRPINAASAAAIFSDGSADSKTSALNALSGTVGDASLIPGLNYANKVSPLGTQPHLYLTWKTPSGKQAVVIFHTVRNSSTLLFNQVGVTTAVEE